MKEIIFAILMILAFTYVPGQDKENTIKDIEQKIESINQDTNYKIVSVKNEAFLDTGFIKQQGNGYGQLTGYFKNNKICKICERIGVKLLDDIGTTEYYFWDEKLIFVYEYEKYGPDISIDSIGTVDYRKQGFDFEGKYYLNNDKIINSITNGQQQILPNEMYFDSQSKEGQLLLSAQKYIDLLSKKK